MLWGRGRQVGRRAGRGEHRLPVAVAGRLLPQARPCAEARATAPARADAGATRPAPTRCGALGSRREPRPRGSAPTNPALTGRAARTVLALADGHWAEMAEECPPPLRLQLCRSCAGAGGWGSEPEGYALDARVGGAAPDGGGRCDGN